METGKLKSAYEPNIAEPPKRTKESSMVLFVRKFENQVSRMNENAEKIKNSLNEIEHSDGVDSIPMSNDDNERTLTDRLRILIDRMEHYNSKLENCANHLDQII